MSFWQTLRQPLLPSVMPLGTRLDKALCVTLALLGFVLPASVAAVAILLGVLLVLGALAAPSVWRSAPWRDPVIALGLLLFAYIATHTLLTSGFNLNSWKAINRYHELLIAALLLALFRLVSKPHWFLHALVAGTLVYAAVHWLALFWPPLEAYMERRRISAGFIMATLAFVLLARGALRRPWPVAGAAFLVATVFFAVEGRTGHVVMLLLVALAAWVYSPKRWRWIATAALPLLVLALALGSTAVQKRVNETLAGSSPAPDGDLSSTGIRIELARNGLHLAGQYGLTGGGFAEYLRLSGESANELYANDPERHVYLERHWSRISNPHNEYLMQLVGGGVAAFALFLMWLVAPTLRRSSSRATQVTLVGTVLAFASGCLFNSMLMDFEEGHFYVVLMTWLLARSAAETAPRHPGAA